MLVQTLETPQIVATSDSVFHSESRVTVLDKAPESTEELDPMVRVFDTSESSQSKDKVPELVNSPFSIVVPRVEAKVIDPAPSVIVIPVPSVRGLW